MTQQVLAEKASIDVRVLSEYENGRRRPQKKNLGRLIAALDGIGEYKCPDSAAGDGGCERSGGTGAAATPASTATPYDELARLVGVRDAKVLLVWVEEGGALSAIAARHDNRLLSIRTLPAAGVNSDLDLLRALLDHALEKSRGSAP